MNGAQGNIYTIAYCHVCGEPAIHTNNAAVYGRPYGEWPYIYLCTSAACGAYIGIHPFSTRPLGTMCDAATRQARRAAHAAFDPLWQHGNLTRSQAYAWLREQMQLDKDACHIGLFNARQCEQVVAIMQQVAA